MYNKLICARNTVALEMRGCQKELERVEAQLEKRGMEMGELQSRLQDADKILVSAVPL